MILDGRKVALLLDDDLTAHVKGLSHTPRLVIVYIGESPVIDTYIGIKQKVARKVGIHVHIEKLRENSITQEIISTIKDICKDADGIVVQLPLPEHVDREAVMSAIPLNKDCDVLSEKAFTSYIHGSSVCIPPVPGAIKALLEAYSLSLEGKSVTVLGKGKLVGSAVMAWLSYEKCSSVMQFDKDTIDYNYVATSDVIISGTGDAWSVTPDMIKNDCILIDAGTSVDKGVSKGDIHPGCMNKARFMSPVPGGIGPVTVRILFKNLLSLLNARHPPQS